MAMRAGYEVRRGCGPHERSEIDTMTRLSFFCSVFVVSTAAAAVPPDVAGVFAATSRFSDDRWAYTRTVEYDEERFAERYDPRLPDGERWTLLEIDGRPPTEKELKQYDKDDRRQDRPTPGLPIEELVDPDSLQLLIEKGDRVEYQFRLPITGPEDEEINEVLIGTLTIDRSNDQVRLEQRNREPFSPAVIAKLTTMQIEMSFQPLDEETTVLTLMETFVEGRVFGIKRINQRDRFEFKDFENVR